MAAITSRYRNGTWRRSNARFDVTDAVPTFAQAISTYPVGQERFLNGSGVDMATSTSNTNANEGGENNGEDDDTPPPSGGGGFGG